MEGLYEHVTEDQEMILATVRGLAKDMDAES